MTTQPTNHTIPHVGRTGIFSLRNVERHVCRCLGYEFEDTIASVEGATVYSPNIEAPKRSRFDHLTLRVARKLLRGRYQFCPNPRVQPVAELGDHEVFFVFCQNVNDILQLSSVPDWRRRSQKTACWIDEIWLKDIREYPKQLDLLKDFDFIFLTFKQTVDYLRSKGFNAFHVPAGIDCMRFSSLPNELERVIDVLAMGRKAPHTHRELFELAKHDKINYVFDTSSLPNVKDHVDHRTLMAKQIGRSRFFFVQRAKADVPHETAGQIELGSRYFEGCAAGAILVGEKLDIQTFEDQFGWTDSVIPMPYDSADITPIMDLLISDPERMNEIHRRNVRHSLLKHDWAYRWEAMLTTMQMEPTTELMDRKKQLGKLAFSIQPDKQKSARQSSVA